MINAHIVAILCIFVAPTMFGCTAARSTPERELTGAESFKYYCASCHGVDAKGNGPVASSLSTPVPDLTQIALHRGGTFPADEIQRIIDGRDQKVVHGTREMPVWGWQLFYSSNAEDPAARRRANQIIQRLVQHLESIQVR